MAKTNTTTTNKATKKAGNGKAKKANTTANTPPAFNTSNYMVTVTPTATGGQRMAINNVAVTTCLRWLGTKGVSVPVAVKAMALLNIPVSKITVTCQIGSGKNNTTHHGKIPVLTSELGGQLMALVNHVVATTTPPQQLPQQTV